MLRVGPWRLGALAPISAHYNLGHRHRLRFPLKHVCMLHRAASLNLFTASAQIHAHTIHLGVCMICSAGLSQTRRILDRPLNRCRYATRHKSWWQLSDPHGCYHAGSYPQLTHPATNLGHRAWGVLGRQQLLPLQFRGTTWIT